MYFKHHAENKAEKVVPDLFLSFRKALYELMASGLHLTEGNAEKIWADRVLAKPKMIATGVLGGPGGPEWCPGESVGAKFPNNFFFSYKTC